MSKSKLSIFALQQKFSRPGTTIVLTVFTLGYLAYLIILLAINMQKGWYAEVPRLEIEQPDAIYVYGSYKETYTYEYYFIGYDFSQYLKNGIETLTDSSTSHYLIRSEIVFFISLFCMTLALVIAHFKASNGGETLSRLSLSKRSIYVMQWLSDCIYTVHLWLSHLVVVFLFYLAYYLNPRRHTLELYRMRHEKSISVINEFPAAAISTERLLQKIAKVFILDYRGEHSGLQ